MLNTLNPIHRRVMAGFTLVETIMVVAVLAIVVAVAAPSFRDMVLSQRVKNASFDVFSSLSYARSEAITRNTTVTVTPTGGSWSNGWTVTESATGTVLRTQNAVSGISITGPVSVSYNGMGRLNAAATSFSLTGASLSASNLRCISIDLSGRPVVKTGTCA